MPRNGLRIELIPREPDSISLGVGGTLLALAEGGAPIIAIPAGFLLSFRVRFSRI
ncbi:hypothetical protein [Streptomyces echinatus]|uniref:Uncharacterized protein n=1 Tax=Streptomyces echinatus TaxID=67293 RepID=A0A7W9PTP6_9ACTN|nr:hypothetical protein [Streptomyces echinatus]MBB5927701.1 hypothetical protein [Streptomyces echinatus]